MKIYIASQDYFYAYYAYAQPVRLGGVDMEMDS